MLNNPGETNIVIVTDAWLPQINGVVRTLSNTKQELERLGYHVTLITPQQFNTVACPGYEEIRLSLVLPGMLKNTILSSNPDYLHIATEGPLGIAARVVAVKQGWRFTTAYHTRFPEYLNARYPWISTERIYRLLRWFHGRSSAVLAPTEQIIRTLRMNRFLQVRHWGRGVDHALFKCLNPDRPINRATPVFLYAGRVSVEKNLDDFLRLDLPGEKWVAGDGPMLATLKSRYPEVRWLGSKTHPELAEVYNLADVFVFPSKTDTFGLVMVEAMACGLPVAAYPVIGPLDVVESGRSGILSHNLRHACLKSLELSRHQAIERASQFNWKQSTQEFVRALVRMQPSLPLSNVQHVIA